MPRLVGIRPEWKGDASPRPRALTGLPDNGGCNGGYAPAVLAVTERHDEGRPLT